MNPTTTASLTAVLRHLADEFDNFMPEPSSFSYATYDDQPPIVSMHFRPEGAACVETWAAKYGSRHGQPNRLPHADGAEWMSTDTTTVLGLAVHLYGFDPREPEPAVLVGEVTSPHGPCSGLAYDKRDNTCPNFAAEYVEWVEGGATNLRRLCTGCADIIPITVSRQPLTTAPGQSLLKPIADAAVLVAESTAELKAQDRGTWEHHTWAIFRRGEHWIGQCKCGHEWERDSKDAAQRAVNVHCEAIRREAELGPLVEVQPDAEQVQP